MKIYIKYMVSRRCIMMVKANLEEIGIKYSSVQLGEIETLEKISIQQQEQLRTILLKSGLELMDDKKAIQIEQIKTIIIELIHHSREGLKVNFSDYLSKKLNNNYTYLANLFSEAEGITIEHFIIIHKIEKVKELILYDELNLAEISYKLHYSSAAHLSNQFKKVTGLTPTFYKNLKNKRRNNIENL
ncbi:AraC family transcriptional regulator [Dysgonomonas sp. BGC7]|uniref:helix-turn-helix domain-containing protein n=1 Tax=Dysgonomonas sp. BGC7 TaxID=1658008 RepID=UPI000681DF36|nr:AraC family transcriptional regulator [Dysgonomonas sp. BGC7]MBD8388862.1 helix-turn-helix transcriptional regulator [Dysgonomonas sp. BGC7]